MKSVSRAHLVLGHITRTADLQTPSHVLPARRKTFEDRHTGFVDGHMGCICSHMNF